MVLECHFVNVLLVAKVLESIFEENSGIFHFDIKLVEAVSPQDFSCVNWTKFLEIYDVFVELFEEIIGDLSLHFLRTKPIMNETFPGLSGLELLNYVINCILVFVQICQCLG